MLSFASYLFFVCSPFPPQPINILVVIVTFVILIGDGVVPPCLGVILCCFRTEMIETRHRPSSYFAF